MKSFPYQWFVGIIVGSLVGFATMVQAYTNLERDVELNTQSRIAMKNSLHALANGIQDIREGLISEGIIKVK